MMRWFASLPIHRKLVTMALAVSATALAAAVAGLIAFDVVRFHRTAQAEAQGLAQVIAENAAAAIVFDDADAARQMLRSVQGRPTVRQACAYRADSTLLAAFQRSPDASCPAMPADKRGWRVVASRVPVLRNGRVVGAIYIERTLVDLPGRIFVTATAGLIVLVLAGVLALGLARRLQQGISRPIVALANAARAIGREPGARIPAIDAPPDETGELVHAFSDMVTSLVSSNENLRLEIEERRRVEAERESLLAREREASRLKDEFLAAVSHELRTPLNAILGWTQVLTSTNPNEQTMAKALASLARNAQAQSRVIEDLLDTSRIITGKLRLNLTALDLRAAVESAIDVIAPMASAKNIRLECHLPPAPCVVQADADRIRQVLWNILSNAMKFTPPGGTVTVGITARDGTFEVAVSDTGIGIAPGFLPHVFERFRQADGSTTREHGGLGLGLSIVKELTELHGGSVGVTSEGEGLGTTFTFRLPRIAASAARTEASQAPPGPLRLHGIEILAVDDDTDALDIVAAMLTAAGAHVRTASSGMDALAQIRRAPVHVVLCDIAMPGIDGFEVLTRIRGFGGTVSQTPILAVTAYASDEYRGRCLRAGFQGHVRKPFSAIHLIQEIAAVLAEA